LALPIFLAVFFVCKLDVFAFSPGIIINEIQTAGVSANDEFIELYNPSSSSVDISKWSIQYRGGSGAVYYKKNFESNNTIPAHGYFLVAHGGNENYSGVAAYNMSWSQGLSSSGGTIFLVNNQNSLVSGADASIVDKVGYGASSDYEKVSAKNPVSKESIGRIDGKDTDDNSQDFTIQDPSPGKENKKMEEKIPEPPKTYCDKIQITELFPNPFQSQYEEYIELYNGTKEDVDLIDWTLHDASKSGKYSFPAGVVIKAEKYLAIFKKDFKFALNNSGDESVTLFDPNGKEISKALYDGSKRDVSYDFDGSRWRWSKFLTPGQENVLNNEPYGTVKIDDQAYVNVYVNFLVSVGDLDGDAVKITWDFGDGHKSYMVSTKHKYTETGKYEASVKLSDGSEDVVKNFTVEVGEVSHPKVRIVAINANPKGADTGEESLTIENKSNKKINLKGWSIATGWKKFTNHPIKEDVIIKKNKTKELTADVSSFTLNNTKAKIQLRYPDGKVAQEVKYKKTSEIGEGEIYQKVKGGWVWKIVISNQELVTSNKNTKVSEQEAVDSEQGTINNRQDTIIKIQETSEEQNTKRENKILTGEDDLVKIELLKNQPTVLGAETVREVGGQYFFTPQIEQKHYLVSFWERILTKLNTGMNQLLNYFRSVI